MMKNQSRVLTTIFATTLIRDKRTNIKLFALEAQLEERHIEILKFANLFLGRGLQFFLFFTIPPPPPNMLSRFPEAEIYRVFACRGSPNTLSRAQL